MRKLSLSHFLNVAQTFRFVPSRTRVLCYMYVESIASFSPDRESRWWICIFPLDKCNPIGYSMANDKIFYP